MPKAQRAKHNNTKASPYGTGVPSGKAGFKHNTSTLGQHILRNPGIADVIVKKAELKQGDIVLEVGSGTGNLTMKLLESGVRKVIAVEKDERMAAELTKRIQGKPYQKKLELLTGDVIKMTLPYFDACISNTPYTISSPLTFKLLACQPPPRVCVLMHQLEFSERLTARPGSSLFGRLSLNVQLLTTTTHIMKVGRKNFSPPPLVESSVIKMVPKVPRPQVDFDEWDGLLRLCFVRGSRTLRSNLLGSRTAMSVIESNYRTWCAQNEIPLEDGPPEETGAEDMDVEGDEEEWGGIMDVDDAPEDDVPDFFKEEKSRQEASNKGNPNRKKKGKVAELVREKVRRVLEDKTELAQMRSSKLDETSFLRLLYEFNKEGIHFS